MCKGLNPKCRGLLDFTNCFKTSNQNEFFYFTIYCKKHVKSKYSKNEKSQIQILILCKTRPDLETYLIHLYELDSKLELIKKVSWSVLWNFFHLVQRPDEAPVSLVLRYHFLLNFDKVVPEMKKITTSVIIAMEFF